MLPKQIIGLWREHDKRRVLSLSVSNMLSDKEQIITIKIIVAVVVVAVVVAAAAAHFFFLTVRGIGKKMYYKSLTTGEQTQYLLIYFLYSLI